MGRAKEQLPFAGQTLLLHTLNILDKATYPLVLVGREEQDFGPLPCGVEVTVDGEEGQGPLRGLHAGLLSVGQRADFICLTSVDTPFLNSDILGRMASYLEKNEAAVIRTEGDAGIVHPMPGLYRTSIVSTVETLLEGEERSLQNLLNAIDTRYVTPEDISDIDPDLACVININTPADYDAAVKRRTRDSRPDAKA